MESEVTTEPSDDTERRESSILHECRKKKIKNIIGFWMLGLCNNYAYVIMLSSAFDLLGKHADKKHFCNPSSTGSVLLADILPALAVKFIAPFLNININIRVGFCVLLSSASFLLTSLSVNNWMIFAGVICAALSSGLGEVTFLSLSSYFHKSVVSSWSSGTGGAGIIGALSYAALTEHLGVSTTLQVMLIFPVLLSISFWLVIDTAPVAKIRCRMPGCSDELEPMIEDSIDLSTSMERRKYQKYSLQEKIALVKPLLKYMIPLGLVYFAEYFINQGLMELLYFNNSPLGLTHEKQYRWYQVDYQIGVFISRSSVDIVHINKLWLLPILQGINLIFLLCEAYYNFIPSIWIVFIIIFYEGLLGGSAYVNTFYKITEEVPDKDRDFSMGVASLADSVGIALAGAVSLPVHSALCALHD